MNEQSVYAYEGLPIVGNVEAYDLSIEFSMGMPVPLGSPGYNLFLVQRHDDPPLRPAGVGSAVEWFSMSGHTGTHIDALGHAASHGRLMGDLSARELTGKHGLTDLDVTALGIFLARGVLLDVAHLDGGDYLAAGRAIREDELVAAAEASGGIQTGDVALIRTGWIQNWSNPDVYLGYPNGVPGLALDASDWLVSQGATLIGSDTHALEVIVPGEVDRPVHGTLLSQHGVPIIENLNLEDLARAGRHSFLFVAAPTPLRGATGAPIRPLAIVGV